MPGSGPMQPNLAAVAHDAANLAREKQRPQVTSMMMSNETYGTMLDLNLLPPGPTPPLPPRAPNRGQMMWGSHWVIVCLVSSVWRFTHTQLLSAAVVPGWAHLSSVSHLVNTAPTVMFPCNDQLVTMQNQSCMSQNSVCVPSPKRTDTPP